MGKADKHNRFEEEVFLYRISKDKKVFISWHGKQVMILNSKESEKILAKIRNADELKAQLIMAKITGNFKRENEKATKGDKI